MPHGHILEWGEGFVILFFFSVDQTKTKWQTTIKQTKPVAQVSKRNNAKRHESNACTRRKKNNKKERERKIKRKNTNDDETKTGRTEALTADAR